MTPDRAHDLEALLADAAWMRRLARSLTRDPDEADELAQDAWVAALGAPQREGRAGARRGWLRAVLRNVLWRRRRDEARRREREQRVARAEGLQDASAELARMELTARLARAILALEEPYRSAVVLRHQDGLSAAAIAQRQGTTPAAARQRVSRGLAMLRERLDREQGRDAWLPSLALVARGASAPALATLRAGIAALLLACAGSLAWLAWPEASAKPGLVALLPAMASAATHVPRAGAPLPTASFEQREPLVAAAPLGEGAQAPVPIAGHVVDARGAPLAGALVELLPHAPPRPALLAGALAEAPPRPLRSTRTDPAGSFLLEPPARGLLDLRASQEGHAPTSLACVQPGAAPRLVLHEAAAIEGLVVAAEDGAPLAGARVEVRGVFPETRTVCEVAGDAGGRFRVEALAPGSYELLAAAPGRVPARLQALLVEVRGGELRHASLALGVGASVRGRVRDARTGEPIAGCRVSDALTLGAAAVTDEHGRYELGGLEITTLYLGSIVAEAPGYGRWERVLGSLPPEGRELDFELLPARRASGRVLGPDGRPVSDALVVALARAHADGALRSEVVAVRSGADGRFVLAGLRPDLRHALHVEAPGLALPLAAFPAQELELDALELGDVRMQAAVSVSGRVLDEHDRPLAGIFVSAQLEDDSELAHLVRPSAPLALVTDGEGCFAFERLAPGRLLLAASRKGFARGDRLRFSAYPGEAIEDVVLRVPVGSTISGRVLDSRGQPAVQASVHLFPLGSEQEMWDPKAQRTLTDGAGAFLFAGLSEGEHGLYASGEGLLVQRAGAPPQGRSATCTAATGTDDLVLVLEEAELVEGLLLDASGAPLAAVIVYYGAPSPQPVAWLSAPLTDWDGRFRFRVRRGALHVLSVRYELEGVPGLLELPGVEGGRRDVTLRLPEGAAPLSFPF